MADSDRYKITGNLTMKETTNSISFVAQVTEDAGTFTAVSDTIRLDRTQGVLTTVRRISSRTSRTTLSTTRCL
ncbi:hypothetical protein ACTML9_00455 [Porphyromonas levii]|uniref:hypothetical protein n=1 Tax=Porphyromonas levii TaxID=28114 RepID=UPI003FA0500F